MSTISVSKVEYNHISNLDPKRTHVGLPGNLPSPRDNATHQGITITCQGVQGWEVQAFMISLKGIMCDGPNVTPFTHMLPCKIYIDLP